MTAWRDGDDSGLERSPIRPSGNSGAGPGTRSRGARSTPGTTSGRYACLRRGALAAMPRANLVSNIGFGEGAHHTSGAENPLAKLPTPGIRFPLRHPESLERDEEADAHTAGLFFGAAARGAAARKDHIEPGGMYGSSLAHTCSPTIGRRPAMLGLSRPSLGPTTRRRHSTSSSSVRTSGKALITESSGVQTVRTRRPPASIELEVVAQPVGALSSRQLVDGVVREEDLQVRLAPDHVLPAGEVDAARAEDTAHLASQGDQVRDVVEDLPRVDDVDGLVRERDLLPDPVEDLHPGSVQPLDRAPPHHRRRIRLERVDPSRARRGRGRRRRSRSPRRGRAPRRPRSRSPRIRLTCSNSPERSKRSAASRVSAPR